MARLGEALRNNILTVLATIKMLQHVTDDMPGYMWVNMEEACIFKHYPLICSSSFLAMSLNNKTWSGIVLYRSVVNV